jgi:hypothetical protein
MNDGRKKQSKINAENFFIIFDSIASCKRNGTQMPLSHVPFHSLRELLSERKTVLLTRKTFFNRFSLEVILMILPRVVWWHEEIKEREKN